MNEAVNGTVDGAVNGQNRSTEKYWMSSKQGSGCLTNSFSSPLLLIQTHAGEETGEEGQESCKTLRES